MKTSMSTMKKTVFAAAAAAALGLASAGATAATVFNDFQVDPSNYSNKTQFTADKITGNYSEVITLNNDGTFNASLKWEAGQFVKDDGVNALAPVRTGLGATYGLYALYQASGTFSTIGGVTTFTTNAGLGNLSFWIDPQADSYDTFTAPLTGAGAWTVGGAADILIATGTPQAGSGMLDPSSPSCSSGAGAGINCGSFGTTVSFALNDAGKAFFVDPVPFYNLSFQSGQFNNFQVSGTQSVNGSLDVVFSTASTVPEPGSLALLGLAAVGLGVSVRRRAR
jgi:hypothetical protein